MNTPIDIYCERTDIGLWDEPLNLISNAAFLIAAFMAYKFARRENTFNFQTAILIGLIAVIGIGSSLFHSFANTWSKLADVIPIILFQISFIIIYAGKVIKLNKGQTALLLLGFFALSFASGLMPYDWLNGSLGYSPALIYVLGLGIYHFKSRKNEPVILLTAGGIFLLSLIFRSIDNAVCNSLPLGVHYAWHILNSVVLYLSARSIIKNI